MDKKDKSRSVIDDLDVTGVLDPDLQEKDLTLTEEDIDFEIDALLLDSKADGAGTDDFDFGAGAPPDPAGQNGESLKPDLDDEIDFDLDEALIQPEESGRDDDSISLRIADDDLDFELDEPVGSTSESSPGSEVSDGDIDFELDEPAGPRSGGSGSTDFLDDIDFELDEPAGSLPEASASSDSLGDDIDFELDEPADSLPESSASADALGDDIDFELDEPADALPESSASADALGDDIDFELDEPAGSLPESSALADALGEDIDFELDEISMPSEEDFLQVDDLDAAAPKETGPKAEAAPVETEGPTSDFELEDLLKEEGISAEPSSADEDETLDFDLEDVLPASGQEMELEAGDLFEERDMAGAESGDDEGDDDTIDIDMGSALTEPDGDLIESAPSDTDISDMNIEADSFLNKDIDSDLITSYDGRDRSGPGLREAGDKEFLSDESSSEDVLDIDLDGESLDFELSEEDLADDLESGPGEAEDDTINFDLDEGIEPYLSVPPDQARTPEDSVRDNGYNMGDTIVKSMVDQGYDPIQGERPSGYDTVDDLGFRLDDGLMSRTNGDSVLPSDKSAFADSSAAEEEQWSDFDLDKALLEPDAGSKAGEEILDIGDLLIGDEREPESGGFDSSAMAKKVEEDIELRDLISTATLELAEEQEAAGIELDRLYRTDDGDLEPAVVKEHKSILPPEGKIDRVEEFELEEVVEQIPELPVDTADSQAVQAELVLDGEELHDYPMAEAIEKAAPFSAESAAKPSLSDLPVQDMAGIESLIVKTVQETVRETLRQMLPGLIDEVLTRELEKLREELE